MPTKYNNCDFMNANQLWFLSPGTNLDVNLAVNNLLSRDDEEGDDADDSQGIYQLIILYFIVTFDNLFYLKHFVYISLNSIDESCAFPIL